MFDAIPRKVLSDGETSIRLNRMVEILGKTVEGILGKGMTKEKFSEMYQPVVTASNKLEKKHLEKLWEGVFMDQVRGNVAVSSNGGKERKSCRSTGKDFAKLMFDDAARVYRNLEREKDGAQTS